MSDTTPLTRRGALKCLAFGGAGTLFALAGGVFTPIDLAVAAADRKGTAALGKPLFVQISDTHIGFNKEANPDVAATLNRSIDIVNGLPEQPALIIHTGDITHLSKPAEFDLAQQLFSRLRTTEMHTTPGEHDTTDLKGRSASTPIVVFAHMPLWTIYEPWGWGTSDAPQLMEQLRRFGSVTVLNGHIHQIVQKVEGTVTFHTARSTAYPQPAAGEGAGPGPLKVPTEQLPGMLGVTSAMVVKHPSALRLDDTTNA